VQNHRRFQKVCRKFVDETVWPDAQVQLCLLLYFSALITI
jgi:hypothetical protein